MINDLTVYDNGDDLKPCPYCQSKDLTRIYDDVYECFNCGTRAQSPKIWNALPRYADNITDSGTADLVSIISQIWTSTDCTQGKSKFDILEEIAALCRWALTGR